MFEQPSWKLDIVQGRIRKPWIDFFLAHSLAAEQGKSIALGELFAEYKAFVATASFADTASELLSLTKKLSTHINRSRYAVVGAKRPSGAALPARGRRFQLLWPDIASA